MSDDLHRENTDIRAVYRIMTITELRAENDALRYQLERAEAEIAALRRMLERLASEWR